MIGLNAFKKIMEENNGRLPLLSIDEFFNGNTIEDAIAPNQCGFGRPSLDEIWSVFQKIEVMPEIAWVRIALHDDTEIIEYDGKEVLELLGDEVIICTSFQAPVLEELVNCKWLCSDGVEEWTAYELDSFFSCRPPVPDGFCCYGIMWD